MANEMRDRLKENISIIKQHNERGLPVKHITKGQKYEVEVIAEIVEDVSLIIEKLENKTLIELPCKVGDTVYVVENPYTFVPLKKVLEGYVMSIHQHEHGLFLRVLFDTKKINGSVDYNLDWRLGKTVFLTKAEAEQKLKEMRGGNG